jgi:hypothetical protein
MPKGLIETLSGVKTHEVYDPHDDVLTVRRCQDVEPFLKDNARLRNSGDGYSPSRELRHVAHVPNIIIEQWLKAGIDIYDPNDADKVDALLDSPDYAYLRTSTGTISRRRHRNRSYFGTGGSRRSTAEVVQDIMLGVGKGF